MFLDYPFILRFLLAVSSDCDSCSSLLIVINYRLFDPNSGESCLMKIAGATTKDLIGGVLNSD